MDGRQAVINVLTGMVIGMSVPFIIAWMLTTTYADFRWLDHLFTILMASVVCGALGVFINLPWASSRSGRATSSEYAQTRSRHRAGAKRERVRVTSAGEEETRQERAPVTPPKHYAMSRIEALRAFNLPHDATDEEIRDTYRRLAKEHHPDHVAADGPEAMEEATKKFVRIREAYDVLVDEA